MNTKNVLYGALCGALVFMALSWTTARKTVRAAVLTEPPEGRFELVQLHPNQGNTWSGILDTETGCTWVYTSQTPPTDAEVSAAPEGEQRTDKIYRQALGSNYFESVGYGYNGATMTVPGAQKPSAFAEAKFSTLATEVLYCDEARLNALRAARAR
jgi:hypothetical protein